MTNQKIFKYHTMREPRSNVTIVHWEIHELIEESFPTSLSQRTYLLQHNI